MEKISWTDRMKNEALRSVKEERNILYSINRRKANCIGHMLHRNCLLKHATEDKIEVTARLGRRRKQLLGDLRETRRYWNLKRAGLDRAL
jgi:hypothetical protein